MLDYCELYILEYATKTFHQLTVTCVIVSINFTQTGQNGRSESNKTKRCHLFDIQAAIKATKNKKFNYLPNLTNCINVVEMVFGCGIFQWHCNENPNGKMK